MPNIQIEVISVGAIQKVPTAKGFYETVEVAYRKDGKVEGKKIMSFANPAIFKAVQKLAQGETVDVTTEKNEAGFWQWTGLNSGAAVTQPTPSQTSSAASTGTVAAKPVSNYETKEERAARQVMIVRQSSLSNAVSTLSVGAKHLTPSEVVAVAKEYERYVLGLNEAKAAVDVGFSGDEDLVL
jgi:hypothetical protein